MQSILCAPFVHLHFICVLCSTNDFHIFISHIFFAVQFSVELPLPESSDVVTIIIKHLMFDNYYKLT